MASLAREIFRRAVGSEGLAADPKQTGWAMLALMAAGEAGSKAVSRGVEYLLATQKQDGTWDEDAFTGTGFPKFFMIKYHIYRNCFPLTALGKYRRLTAADVPA